MALYPYFQNPALVHCPSDKRHIKPSPTNPAKDGGYRTYSFPYHVGGTLTTNMVSSGWALSTTEQCEKIEDIRSPGSKFVLVEENDCRGLNQGPWAMRIRLNSGFPGLIDSFGIYHNMRSILGFGDGHAEKIVWSDDRTEKFSQGWFDGTLTAYTTTSAEEINNADLLWLASHYPKK